MVFICRSITASNTSAGSSTICSCCLRNLITSVRNTSVNCGGIMVRNAMAMMDVRRDGY